MTFSPKSDSYDEPNLSAAAAAGDDFGGVVVVCAAPLWLVCIEVSLCAHTRFYYVFPLLRAQGMTFWVTLDPTKENAPRSYKSARIQKQLVENGRAAWGANPRGVLSGALFFFFLLLFAPLFSHAAVSPVWQTHAHEYNVYKQGFLNEVDNGWTRLRSRRFYGPTNFYMRIPSIEQRKCLLTDERGEKGVTTKSVREQKRRCGVLYAILMHLKPRSQIL